MEKFLQKFEDDIQQKMLSCANGESIVKPFNKIYEEVRDKNSRGRLPQFKKKNKIYSEKEESIYKKVIEEFLTEHPAILEKISE
jgi:hypothetical protein